MRGRTAALALVAAALLGGCGHTARRGAVYASPTRRGTPPGEVTPAFQAMRSVLSKAERAAADPAALRGISGEVLRTGIALLRSTMPHDLARANVPRFLEGRAAFGEALQAFATAAERGDDASLAAGLPRVVDAYWGWVDAYKGLAPERAV